MSVRYEHVELVSVSPEKAFAVIDDLPRTAEWLPPCVSLKKIGSGPNATGDKLHYVFRQGGKQSDMEGEILARSARERLHCRYFDAAFEVGVDMRVAPDPQGCRITHIIEITPKTWFGKLLSPLIRLALGKQTRDASANLKRLLEEASPSKN